MTHLNNKKRNEFRHVFFLSYKLSNSPTALHYLTISKTIAFVQQPLHKFSNVQPKQLQYLYINHVVYCFENFKQISQFFSITKKTYLSTQRLPQPFTPSTRKNCVLCSHAQNSFSSKILFICLYMVFHPCRKENPFDLLSAKQFRLSHQF